MKRYSSIRLVAATIAVGLILVSCNASGQSVDRVGNGASDGGGRPGGGAPGRPVSTESASLQARNQIIQVGGRLRPLTRIDHQVPVTGLIREVAVETGDRVSAGTVLYTIERDEIGQTFRPVPVEARISGVVSDVEIQEAQQVRIGDAAVTVVGDDGFILEAQVSDKDASNVQIGAPVVAHTVDDVELDGTLSLRSAEPDYETGLFSVTFSFDAGQPAGIGSFLVIDLPTQNVEGIFVSRDSVDRRYGRFYLWVVDEEAGVFTRREVTLGEIVGDEVVVETGIEVGERYITRLSGREREGAPAPPPEEREG